MLAAGRSFPAATTVRRASARTAATGRAWRATPASSPNNNVRGLSSEGTPGTVAGARAAGATPPPTPPLRGGGASTGGGSSAGGGGGDGGGGGGGGGVGGAAAKLVVLTAAVVGVNMVAYAKVPSVKKMVDERLEGPLPPEVYDIYRRCGVDVPPPYWKLRSQREAWDFGVVQKMKEEARRLSPFNSDKSTKPTEKSKGNGFEIDTSRITKKGFSVSSRLDDGKDKTAATTAITTTTEPTAAVTKEQGAASSPSPWARRDSSSSAPDSPSNASAVPETSDDGGWEAGAAAAVAEANEAVDSLAAAVESAGGSSSSSPAAAADAADSAASSASAQEESRSAASAVVVSPAAGGGSGGGSGGASGGGEIADPWAQEAGSAAAAAATATTAAGAGGEVSAVTADAAGVVEAGTAAAAVAKEEEEAVALEGKKRRIRNEALSKVAEEMEVASAGLKRELEHSMLKDLKELDEDSLRFRVAQLATEMQESAKWESLRLMDGVKKMEAEIARKYETLLSEQKELYSSETGKALREQEEELASSFMEDYNKQLRYHLEHQASEFKEALHANATAGRDALRQELAAKHAEEIDAIKAEELKASEAVLNEVKDLTQKTEETLTVLEAARIAEEADKAASETVHRVTHATLALAERFAGSAPIGPELDNLLRLSGGDALLEAAAGSIPRDAASKGISTVPQLRQRFAVVKKECRRAALMPEGAGGGLFGHLLASVLAKVTFAPKGMLDGEGAEVALARADHLLEAGELNSAVREVEKLSGLPADVAEDWLKDAKTRLTADEALRVFRCHASLLNAKHLADLDRKA